MNMNSLEKVNVGLPLKKKREKAVYVCQLFKHINVTYMQYFNTTDVCKEKKSFFAALTKHFLYNFSFLLVGEVGKLFHNRIHLSFIYIYIFLFYL